MLNKITWFAIIIFTILFIHPAVQLCFGFYRNNYSEKYINAGLQYDSSITGFEGLPQINLAPDVQVLCDDALYLGMEDIYENCADKCKSGDYEYLFIKEKNKVIINTKRLVGAYCIKKYISKCNLNTSMAVIGQDGYKCISHHPNVLGGESGNLIIACNGIIMDRLEKTIYDTFIPTNLTLNTFDDKLDDGSYRFKCANSDVQFPSHIGSRLEDDINICRLFSSTGQRDEANARCICSSYINGDEKKPCTDCLSGWNIDTKLSGKRYAYNISRDCVEPTADSVYTDFVKIPCGDKTLALSNRCENAIVLATNTYTPLALENMYG